MSLLLLFPSGAVSVPVPVFCWGRATLPAAAWAGEVTDYKDTWGDWSGYTWGQINSLGYTWSYMTGYTFNRTTTGTATWTTVPKATQNCP